MTEPIYEFVRGRGWIATKNEQESLEFFYGERSWLLLARKPKVGERFQYACRYNDIYTNAEGKPKLKDWASKYFSWTDPEELKKFDDEGYPVGVAFVTVVPL